MVNNGNSRYKWYIVALSSLTQLFVMAVQNSSMPVLFQEISEDLDLSIVQLGTVWGMVGFGSVVIILVGGLIGDRFGVKRTLGLVCFLGGISGALRGLSSDFFTLAVTMFLFGLASAFIPTIGLKVVNMWFPRKQLGLANSIITISVATGLVIGPLISGTVMSPLLGGWRNVLYLYGGIAFMFSIPWLLIRDRSEQEESPGNSEKAVSFRQSLMEIIHNKNIWFLGLIFLGMSGCTMGMRGYLPTYLKEVGWVPSVADGALSLTSGASILGVFPITFLSHRFGSKKTIMFITVLMTAAGVGLLSITDGFMIWVSLIIAGITFDGYMAILHTMVMESEGVKVEHTATAIGLVHTIGRMGNLSAPPIGNSLATINPSLGFIFWSALAIIPLVSCISVVKETSWKTG